MWYWILGIVCTLLGGWGGYAWGQKVKDFSEHEFMTAKGYVKVGEDWVKRVTGQIRNIG